MEVWISLLQVQALPRSEFAGEWAYLNGLVLAASAREAEAALEGALWQLGWRLVGAEDTQQFSWRCSHFEVEPELKELAQVATQTGEAQFGTFYTWVETGQTH